MLLQKKLNKNLWGFAILNEESCGKPQGINSHITNTAATLWQATGNSQVKHPYNW